MKSKDVRNTFLNYFEKNGHTIVPSSRLTPEGDSTLLFTNAGMNQFKNSFLGLEKRHYNRATTSQKCVRAGGKHNDLEQVGHTARHHTFFEMLGNFSFGDYFKKDAIRFAWELLTKVYGIPKDRLYVTVFETDDEAADIWHKQEKVSKDRIFRLGEKDNFWRMGDTGPCGPCSEIYFDLRPNETSKFGEDDSRFFEIWNLVFMQFNEDESGKKNPLPKPSVDTGAGLERMCCVMQEKQDNFFTDLFSGVIKKAEKISGIKSMYGEHLVSKKVLADHARTTAFLIADGIIPTNEGRGYVLRRIMRRAIRYGRKLSQEKSLLVPLVEEVIKSMSDIYPELESQSKLILKTTKSEEESFLKTLDQGTDILMFELGRLKKSNDKILKGEVVFKLYDTYGFPSDLTRIISSEQGFQIDESGFEESMNKAKALSQASWKGQAITANQAHLIELSQSTPKTVFLGYEMTHLDGKILKLSDGQSEVESLSTGQAGFLITDQTPFYAESGGQVGDKGIGGWKNGKLKITDCQQTNGVFIHTIEVTGGALKNSGTITLEVNDSARRETANHHSATHLMHAALRKVLGDHVTQAGSLVEPNRLRFDFTHDKPLTDDEKQVIENLVNDEISKAVSVETNLMGYNEAIKTGAMALFGEKYGDKVRVLKMGDFSVELCGGTHVRNTSDIRAFFITSETGVSRGVRRIEAVAGKQAFDLLTSSHKKLKEIEHATGVQSAQIPAWIEERKKEIKNLEKKIQTISSQSLDLDALVKNARKIKGGQFVSANLEIDDKIALSTITDKLRDKLKTGVVFVAGRGETTHPIIISVSKDLVSQHHAGKLLQEIAPLMGGKGGGRPDFAQGAAADVTGFEKANIKLIQMLS